MEKVGFGEDGGNTIYCLYLGHKVLLVDKICNYK